MLNSIIRKYLDYKFHPNWTIHVGCTVINSLTAPIFTKLKSLKKLLCTPPVKNFCHRVKKTQLDAQLILSIFRQPLHVSGVSRSIIRRYNRMYTKNKLCIKLVFLYTIISRCTVNTKHKILIIFGRKVYKIQATFNLHPLIKYGFQHTNFNVTHNCIMALSAEWKFCLTSWYDPRFMPFSNNILHDDPLLGKIKFGLIFVFRRSPARIWTEMECFIWELLVRSPCDMPCRHRGKAEVKLYMVLNGSRRTKHLSGCLVLGKEPLYPLHWLGGGGTTAGLNGCGEKISCPHRTSNPKPAARSNSLYRLRSPDPQVLVQVPNTDFRWNFFFESKMNTRSGVSSQ